jgi:hydrogenase nickel incorporation protein HypA/HybF
VWKSRASSRRYEVQRIWALAPDMHELGIASSILEAVEAEAKKHAGARFKVVGLRIGEVAGIDVDALTFGWEAVTRDTDWDGLKLAIEQLPLKNRCRLCKCEFAVKDYEIACPECGRTETENISGDELDIAYMEIEEANA